MTKRKHEKLVPQIRTELRFNGATFWTMNMGAPDPMTGEWVWFAVGKWTHDQDDGRTSHCCLAGAIASRFGLDAHPKVHADGARALEWARQAIFLEEPVHG